jgi:hypothetical protein
MRSTLSLTTALLCLVLISGVRPAQAAKLTLELTNAEKIKSVGAFQRWDADGNANKLVDKDQKIDQPQVQFTATYEGRGKWVFADLPPNTYDLVIMIDDKTRIEGFSYVPVLEFDPFLAPTADIDPDAKKAILEDIEKSPQYENKIQAVHMGGNKKFSRVLVQLIRDKPTSYTPGAGTMRHEIWQYDWLYGGWKKNKRTKVLDRILMQVADLRNWTWIWEPKLGMIEIKKRPLVLKYEIPAKFDPEKHKGLFPY